jgi:hypothetical protein
MYMYTLLDAQNRGELDRSSLASIAGFKLGHCNRYYIDIDIDMNILCVYIYIDIYNIYINIAHLSKHHHCNRLNKALSAYASKI